MAAKNKKTTKNKDGSALSQNDILGRLSAMTKELSDLHATTVKYHALKRILSSTVEEIAPHTRMPGIRNLALCLGTSLVTTQRAVTELLNENILYSKPRSGVFVNDRAAINEPSVPVATPTAFSSGTDHPFRAVFDFATDSAAPYQRKFWEELATLFSRQYPNVTPALHFCADLSERSKPFDVCERYDWKRSSYGNMDDVLDIADFAGALLPTPPTRGRLLPLYYRTYFLFYNQSLLKKHGLPAPEYRTFAGQTDYLRNLAPQLERLGFNPKPYCTQEPITLFGSRISEFCGPLDKNPLSSGTRQALIGVIEKLIAYCQLFRYSLKDRNDWMQARLEFLRGQAPFFMGYSVDYWELSQKKLPFSLKAYPTLCCDDSLFLWPRVGEISRRSEHPMESMHFLLFLLGEDAQKRFAATGNFGAHLTHNLHPQMAVDPDWMAGVLQKSVPFHFNTTEGYYLAVNVLGGELWRSLVGKVSAAETLDHAVQMGTSYLKHRPARPAGKPSN